jgi:hypothetical protein
MNPLVSIRSPPSHKARVERLEALKKHIQEKASISRDDLYRFGLIEPTFQITMRVMDDYLKQLMILGFIEYDSVTDVVKWKKQKKGTEAIPTFRSIKTDKGGE